MVSAAAKETRGMIGLSQFLASLIPVALHHQPHHQMEHRMTQMHHDAEYSLIFGLENQKIDAFLIDGGVLSHCEMLFLELPF